MTVVGFARGLMCFNVKMVLMEQSQTSVTTMMSWGSSVICDRKIVTSIFKGKSRLLVEKCVDVFDVNLRLYLVTWTGVSVGANESFVQDIFWSNEYQTISCIYALGRLGSIPEIYQTKGGCSLDSTGLVKSYGSMVLFFSNWQWDGLCIIAP